VVGGSKLVHRRLTRGLYAVTDKNVDPGHLSDRAWWCDGCGGDVRVCGEVLGSGDMVRRGDQLHLVHHVFEGLRTSLVDLFAGPPSSSVSGHASGVDFPSVSTVSHGGPVTGNCVRKLRNGFPGPWGFCGSTHCASIIADRCALVSIFVWIFTAFQRRAPDLPQPWVGFSWQIDPSRHAVRPPTGSGSWAFSFGGHSFLHVVLYVDGQRSVPGWDGAQSAIGAELPKLFRSFYRIIALFAGFRVVICAKSD